MSNGQLLLGVPFFQELSNDEREQIAEYLVEQEYVRPTQVIEDGSIGSSIFIIKEGGATVRKMIDDEDEEVLAVLGTGDCFGEMSLFDHRPRSASVWVEAGTKLLEIPGTDFENYMDNNPEAAIKVYKAATLMLCRRLREANQILIYSRLILHHQKDE